MSLRALAWAVVALAVGGVAGIFLFAMYYLSGWGGVMLIVGGFALCGALIWAISELVDH